MQKSKSLVSFGPNVKHIEVTQRPRAPQTRKKSSLDTLVIPGRTRLPSSQSSSEATDILIAQQLLNHGTMQIPDEQHLLKESPTLRSNNRRHGPSPKQNRTRAGHGRPLPKFGKQDAIVITPHRRPDTCMPRSSSYALTTRTSERPGYGRDYDGNNDSSGLGLISHSSSMTWSTVSHRVISNSSASSRASRASGYLQEYNDLAEKHGLHQIMNDSSEEEGNSSQTKLIQKSHPGWLARKIFRRTSSTYTLKAKTTYKPIAKKKSLGGVQLLSENSPTNVLTGKSLEELGRLGGYDILVLPSEYADDKVTLPNCLSATAAYLLEKGCNAAGIFRVSGTTSTINQLYNHYDQQFIDAGSPSKVEETVGSGALPVHPEYVLADIASLFKKIIIGLPGGLLGSLELFEALRSILIDWSPEPQSSMTESSRLRARLIALAISSKGSPYRIDLIKAVLGLVAYFGFEAEKAMDEERAAAASEQDEPNVFKSELMGYQSLGVVLGPLLLGDQTDSISIVPNGGDETSETTSSPRKSTDSNQENGRKSKKQKRLSLGNLVDKSNDLSAHVSRANLTAKVMQSLLVNWKEVVRQLQDIKGSSNTTSLSHRGVSAIRKVPNHAASKLTLKNSEEEMNFLDILRGRTLPDDLRGDVKMKSRIRITSRSPVGRGALKNSKDNLQGRTWLPRASEALDHEIEAGAGRDVEEPNSHHSRKASSMKRSISGSPQVPFTEDLPIPNSRSLTGSDIAMDAMSMGTILPQRKHSPFSVQLRSFSRSNIASQTPFRRQRSKSSSDALSAPETAVKVKSNEGQRKPSILLIGQTSMNKPLPPVGPAQKAELSPQAPASEEGMASEARKLSSSDLSYRSRRSIDTPPYVSRRSTPRTLFPSRDSGSWNLTNDEGTYPPWQSSLPGERKELERAIDPLPIFENLEDYKASRSRDISPRSRPISRKSIDAPHNEADMDEKGQRGSSTSVKLLAKRFAEVSTPGQNNEQALTGRDRGIPTVYAYVQPLPSSTSSNDGPFIFSSKPSPERDSSIPKPIRDLGRARRVDYLRSSRTPSPRKQASQYAPEAGYGQTSAMNNINSSHDAGNVELNIRSDAESLAQASLVVNKDNRSPQQLGRLRRSATGLFDPNIFDDGAEFLSTIGSGSTYSLKDLSEQPGTGREHSRHSSVEQASSLRHDSVTANQSDPVDGGASNDIDDYRIARRALTNLKSHESIKINTALHNEIMRLYRVLDRKESEVQATRRSLDAVREASRNGSLLRGSARDLFEKNLVDEEIPAKAREDEVNFWRARAEGAERILAERAEKRQSAKVEVIVNTESSNGDDAADIYIGEGWDSRDLEVPEDVTIRLMDGNE